MQEVLIYSKSKGKTSHLKTQKIITFLHKKLQSKFNFAFPPTYSRNNCLNLWHLSLQPFPWATALDPFKSHISNAFQLSYQPILRLKWIQATYL